MQTELPQDFVRLMHEHYDEATADALCRALDATEPDVSIRLNPRKLSAEEVLACRPDLEPVPWCPGAFFLPFRPAFTFDPLLHAGAYYVQEAASMYIAQVIAKSEELRVKNKSNNPAHKSNSDSSSQSSGAGGTLFTLHSSLFTLNSSLYESHLDFVLEGGSIESDGKGTIYTTRCCLLAPHRNQPLTEQQIEQELKRRLRADRIVWLDDEPLPGDDTDGHIDTIARILPDGTLLRMPLPDPIYDEDGTQLPATYANYLIINGAVLVPTYGQPANDERAIQRIQEAFPDREMIPIDSRSIIRQHGSIHCCTMQYPKIIDN